MTRPANIPEIYGPGRPERPSDPAAPDPGQPIARDLSEEVHVPKYGAEFYTVAQLKERGWTAALRRRFLGPCDQRLAVDHWKNWSGKLAYRVRRVELAEVSPAFEAAFRESAYRRKLSPPFVDDVIARILELRAAGVDRVIDDVDFETARIDRVAREAAACLAGARAFGFRSPHKC